MSRIGTFRCKGATPLEKLLGALGEMVARIAIGFAVVAAFIATAASHLFYTLGQKLLLRSAPENGAVDIDATDADEFHKIANAINQPRNAGSKRFFDIVLSLSLLFFLAPVLVLTAIAVKVGSPGPVLYRQRRVGYKGQEFEVFKFRSMVTDAEANGPQYAKPQDDRITGVGRIIRKFRIDEIPQTINVLRGEMSFVGPRPERPEFVKDLEQEIPLYQCRHLIKPGITGWAQVKYEYSASVEGARNKLRYDLYYMRHFSPLMDLLIVLMTVRVALFGLGAR